MKKLLVGLLGAGLIITAISLAFPKYGKIFQKHVPNVGNEVVSMSAELAQTGLGDVEIKQEYKDTANRVINDVSEFSHAGFDYYATEDKAHIDRGTRAVKDLMDIAKENVDKADKDGAISNELNQIKDSVKNEIIGALAG